MQQRRSPDPQSLRSALRAHTAAIHRQLDDRVGSFATRKQYEAFVSSSYRFRQAAEPACAGGPWLPQSLVDDLRSDLDDLGIAGGQGSVSPGQFSAPSARLGALYVLEGSALGARLLFRRAEGLGFSDTFGARHLARQCDDVNRWRAFLVVLDEAEDLDYNDALAGAQSMFEAALAIYSEGLHEHA